jgi:hypothetical protein
MATGWASADAPDEALEEIDPVGALAVRASHSSLWLADWAMLSDTGSVRHKLGGWAWTPRR